MIRETATSETAAPVGQRGFSMLEVLISLLILSVALLGIAALVSISLKADDSAYMRTQANDLTYQILDAMRADRSDAINGCYNGTFTATTGSPGCSSPAVTLALTQWQLALTALPSGASGTISTNVVGGVTEVDVSITWNDSRAQQSFVQSGFGFGSPTYSLSVESAL